MQYLQENLFEHFEERLAIVIEATGKSAQQVILDVMEQTVDYGVRLGASRATVLELLDQHREFNEQLKRFNVRGELRAIRRLLGD